MWNAEPPRSTHREKVVYSRAVSYAKRRGWLPPLPGDNIDTDPTPERDVVQQGRVTGEELLEDIAFLLEGGESAEQVAVIVGRKPGRTAKLAERCGDRDIANAFAALGKRAAA